MPAERIRNRVTLPEDELDRASSPFDEPGGKRDAVRMAEARAEAPP